MTHSAPLIKEIGGLLDECGGNDRAMPATTLYNENWLLRLVLDWHKRNEYPVPPFSFDPDATWYSEGLLASPFLKTPKCENHTHADGVVGNIYIEKIAEIWPKKDAKQLIVVEAKLGSDLSKGTKKSPDYNQVARNICCLTHLATAGKYRVHPETIKKWPEGAFAFYLVVPESRKSKFTSTMKPENIKGRIKCRAIECDKSDWYDKNIAPYLNDDVMTVELITWEDVLGKMKSAGCGNEYQMFYDRCVEFDSRLNKKTKNK